MMNSGRTSISGKTKKYSECNFGGELHPDDKQALEDYVEFRKQRALKPEPKQQKGKNE